MYMQPPQRPSDTQPSGPQRHPHLEQKFGDLIVTVGAGIVQGNQAAVDGEQETGSAKATASPQHPGERAAGVSRPQAPAIHLPFAGWNQHH